MEMRYVLLNLPAGITLIHIQVQQVPSRSSVPPPSLPPCCPAGITGGRRYTTSFSPWEMRSKTAGTLAEVTPLYQEPAAGQRRWRRRPVGSADANSMSWPPKEPASGTAGNVPRRAWSSRVLAPGEAASPTACMTRIASRHGNVQRAAGCIGSPGASHPP
jgi:hypothetical protein